MNRYAVVYLAGNSGPAPFGRRRGDDLRRHACVKLRMCETANLEFDSTCPRQVTIADMGDSHLGTFSLITPQWPPVRQTGTRVYGCLCSRASR